MGEISQNEVWSHQSLGRLIRRRLLTSDAPAMIEIASRSFPKVWKLEEFIFFVNHTASRSFGLFLEKDNQLLCYSLGLLAAGTLDLISIATQEEYRRKGLARDLMALYFSAKEIEEIHLEVKVGNAAAVPFYESLGFQRIGLRKKYYANKWDAIVMRRSN